MSECRSERGSATAFFIAALFVAAAVVLVSFARPYIRYNTLRSHTKDILMEDLGNVDMIREKVMADAARLHVPLQEENISVVQQGELVKVSATWSETVDFWGYYQKKLNFSIDEEY